jgi:hypothetical protein
MKKSARLLSICFLGLSLSSAAPAGPRRSSGPRPDSASRNANAALLTGKKSPSYSPSKASGEIPEVTSSGADARQTGSDPLKRVTGLT